MHSLRSLNAGLDEHTFKQLIGYKFRKEGKVVRVAYKFDNGWQTGKWESVSDRATRAEAEHSTLSVAVHTVNFKKIRHLVQLSIATYGIEGKWCLVMEDQAPD